MADDTTTASEVGGHGNTMEPPLPPPTIAATAPPSISRIMSAPCILERSLDQDAAAAVAALAAEEAQAAILSNRFVATTDDEDVDVDVEGAPTCGPPTMCRPPPVLVRPLAPPPPAILAAHPSGENAGAFTPVPTRRFMQRRGTQAGSSGLVAPEMVEEGRRRGWWWCLRRSPPSRSRQQQPPLFIARRLVARALVERLVVWR